MSPSDDKPGRPYPPWYGARTSLEALPGARPLWRRPDLRPSTADTTDAAIIAGRVVEWEPPRCVIVDETHALEVELSESVSPSSSKVGLGDVVRMEVEFVPDGPLVVRALSVLAPDRLGRTKGAEPATQWERMIGHPERRMVLRRRAELTQRTREFFRRREFLEVDTPGMVALPGMEPHLVPFRTRFVPPSAESVDAEGGDSPGTHLYLATSPEYAMKRLLASGFERIFQLGKAFRNAELGALHCPEFVMLEWYRAFAGAEEIMGDTEDLIRELTEELVGGSTITFRGMSIDVSGGFERVTVRDALWRRTGVDIASATAQDLRNALDAGRSGQAAIPDSMGGGSAGSVATAARPDQQGEPPRWDEEDWDEAFHQLLLEAVEPHLGVERPVFLTHYPAPMGALARLDPEDPRWAQRFELYIGGVELANGFCELNDPDEQRRRLEAEQQERRRLGREVIPIDESFLRALERGMPPSGGIALGLDRVLMILLDADSVAQVLPFPAHEFLS